MDTNEISQSILNSHPEVIQILEAINSHQAGQPITVRCATCNELLEVTEVPAVNSLWVICGSGCTSYREQYES